MSVFSPEETATLLPLPPTAKWPEGVFDVEVLAATGLSISLFAPAGTDHQTAHDRDEIYVVVSGGATFTLEGERDRDVRCGDLIYVRKGQEHRFARIEHGFATWVVFLG